MITPQQRNAWRGAYLRELRKIAQTPRPNDWVLTTDWDNALEAHLALFSFCDTVRIFKVLECILKNHPVEVADIDDLYSSDDLLSSEDLYSYLISLGGYGLDNIFSHIIGPEDTIQQLLDSIPGRNFAAFNAALQVIRPNNEILLTKIGYTHQLIVLVNNLIDFLDDIEEDDEGEGDGVMNTLEEWKKRLDSEMLEFFSPSKEFLDAVNYLSVFQIEHLSEEFRSLYCYQVKLWGLVFSLLEEYCRDKEITIINTLLAESESQELIADFERLAFLLFDYVPNRVFAPVSFNLSELKVQKQSLNA